MALIPQEIIDIAKNTDLLSYLRHKGYNLIADSKSPRGKAYRLTEHDSLVISNNMWYWFSQGYGGNTLDFLIKYEGKSFKEAVFELTNYQQYENTEKEYITADKSTELFYKFFYCPDETKEADAYQNEKGWKKIWGSESQGLNGDTWIVYRSIHDLPKWLQEYARMQDKTQNNNDKNSDEIREFKLPERADNSRRVFAYLSKSRCIDPDTISYLMHKKLIYESKDNHNCVFVGLDKDGVPRYANLRGTLTEKSFKKDCYGSNKRFSFSIPGTNNILRVFESAIDVISDISLSKYLQPDVNPYDTHRLSLGGVEVLALHQYLSDYSEIKNIILRLDNDPTGRAAAEKIKNRFEPFGYKVDIIFPREKDVNKDLISFSSKHNLKLSKKNSSVYNKINQVQNLIEASQNLRKTIKNHDERQGNRNVKCDR